MEKIKELDSLVDKVIKKVGNEIVLGTPLGAGKANGFINAIYKRVKANPTLKLTILTALTLEKPKGRSELEKRFLDPFAERVFGDYPDLQYEIDRVKNVLPENINVIEFYFPPGKFSHNPKQQQNYLSTNYTHAARDVLGRGVNVVCQQVVQGEIDGNQVFSLSCNPDITIDIAIKMREKCSNVAVVGEVNPDLPFMYGESIVGPDFFDFVFDNESNYFKLFSPPKMSVCDTDYMIGLHASTLVKDDGEIQIGIGSLGDALVYSLCLRHEENKTYLNALKQLGITNEFFPIIETDGDLNPFKVGLFAATEMFVDSFMGLYKSKILKKKCYDSVVLQRLLNEGLLKEDFNHDILNILHANKAIHSNISKDDLIFLRDFGIIKSEVKWSEGKLNYNEKLYSTSISNNEIVDLLGYKLRNGAVAHAGFFLGSREFYQFLKDLPIEERKLIRMKRISQINQLYGHEEIDRLQRKNGRFINTTMKVSLNGAASSDALENLAQVSGVGGQYNFVAMAHELPDARSILQLRSWRINKKGLPESNIVFAYGNCTIPRHLRDVVITEYGIADLRGKTDEEVAISLINIADSRFQSKLLAKAKKENKIRTNYQIENSFRNNLPHKYQGMLKELKNKDLFPAFPLGCDFTEEELKIGKTLKHIKLLSSKKSSLLKFIGESIWVKACPEKFKPLLQRMDLESPKSLKERLYQKMLIKGFLKVL